MKDAFIKPNQSGFFRGKFVIKYWCLCEVFFPCTNVIVGFLETSPQIIDSGSQAAIFLHTKIIYQEGLS